MSESSVPPEKESKVWLVGLAIGVILALVGPTYLFHWKFDPKHERVGQPTPPDSKLAPTPGEDPIPER